LNLITIFLEKIRNSKGSRFEMEVTIEDRSQASSFLNGRRKEEDGRFVGEKKLRNANCN